MPSESDFLSWIRFQSVSSPRVLLPPGDDLAVLKWDAQDLLIVGSDQVLDTVHFDSRVHSPRDIGRKVMNRNLSDCAAMACLPAAAVITAALPKGTSLDYAKDLYLGIKEAADPLDCPIVGGDTGSWDGELALTVTILGRSAGIKPVTRRGARVGDGIYVTGPLGGSIFGRHMTFTPRVKLARELAARGVNAMIDLSDGLSRDLRRICQQSYVGAIIESDQVPLNQDVVRLRDGRSPLDHALNDGEDYELLFTATHDFAAMATRIGTITDAAEMILLRHRDGKQEVIEPKGWDHAF